MAVPFTFVKVCDYGTTTPVIARTVHQSQQLLNLFSVAEEFKKRVAKVMWEIQRRLLECYKTSQSVVQEIEGGKKAFQGRTKNANDSDDLSIHPWVMNLDGRLESFLHSAKLALRDSGGILSLFFGKNFGHKYHKALEWAKKGFDEDDPLVQVLASHARWISEVIDLRNAVEHPTDKPRWQLHIENFRLVRNGSTLALRDPIWCLTGESPRLVSRNLPAIVDCFLRLSEELYVTSLIKQDTPILVKIEEIPQEERDPSAPVRFQAIGLGVKPE